MAMSTETVNTNLQNILRALSKAEHGVSDDDAVLSSNEKEREIATRTRGLHILLRENRETLHLLDQDVLYLARLKRDEHIHQAKAFHTAIEDAHGGRVHFDW